MEESEERIREHARLRGIDLDAVEVLDISPSSEFFIASQTYDIFSPAEVEREPITASIVERVEQFAPERVFIDPMTQFRYLSENAFQFRRQVVSFLRFLAERGATVLFTSERSGMVQDDDLQFMSDGVIDITSVEGDRTIEVTKFRGSDFMPGLHTLKLVESGVAVFPRLRPMERDRGFVFETISSGIPGVDAVLNGGIERGTVTLITGPSGVGKTTLGMQFMKEAASRGERSVIYAFEEDEAMALRRSDGIGIPARAMVDAGTLQIRKVEPLRYTPDEFDTIVREDVEQNRTRVVMLDSVAGYTLALRGQDLRQRMHALAKYLQARGVALIIVNEQETIFGEFRATEVGLSYLADTLVFLRFVEMNGEMRKAIGVLKKRLGDYEKRLREFTITGQGIVIGAPLTGLRGILSGSPEFIDETHLKTPG
jgi:circadian clock protein KaiC